MTLDIYQSMSSRERFGLIHPPSKTMSNGGAGKISSSSSSGRYPLQSRNPNTLASQGSFSNKSSTEEYNSKDLTALNRYSTLESSNNECNKRLQNSVISNSNRTNHGLSNNASSHGRRTGSTTEPWEGSEPNLPQIPHPNIAKRSNSLPSTSTADEENVMIEEKRRRVNGEGYTIHRYLRGRLLGKGGFAKVYLCTAMDTNKAYAIKIVPKANLIKARARQKVRLKGEIYQLSSMFWYLCF
jgi:hypothetical protein